MAPPNRTFDSLPEDLVQHLLSVCSLDDRIKVLPLVCRRFRNLLALPGACWRSLSYSSYREDGLVFEHAPLAAFLSWALPRASGLHELLLDLPPRGPDGALELVHAAHFVAPVHLPVGGMEPHLFAALGAVLSAAAASLRELELRPRFRIRLSSFLPPDLCRRLTSLKELSVISQEAIEGTDADLSSLTALRRLNFVDENPPPHEMSCLGHDTRLPPSLTWVGLTPAPFIFADNAYKQLIPRCVLSLPGLKFLDVSESRGLTGLDSALPRLTGLTGLALDHSNQPSVPAQLTLLTRLRLLSLHGAFEENPGLDAVDCSPLSALRQLKVLSLSQCQSLTVLPRALEGLTGLKALHIESCYNLKHLPEEPHLPACQVLSMDWQLLRSSHHVLPRLPALRQLILGAMWWAPGLRPEQEPLPEVVAASLRGCRALEQVRVLSYPDDTFALNLDVIRLLLHLPRLCPGLGFDVLNAHNFFVTDCESLALQDG